MLWAGVASQHELSQVMGHAHFATFNHYRNLVVKCDVQAAFLGLPSQKAALQALGAIGLTADPQAPTRLTDEQNTIIANHPEIVRLLNSRQDIKNLLDKSDCNNQECLLAERERINADLKKVKSSLRARTLAEARKTYFRNIDSKELEAQFAGEDLNEPEDDLAPNLADYQIRERARIVRLITRMAYSQDAIDNIKARKHFIKYLAALCGKKEVRRGRKHLLPEEELPKSSKGNSNETPSRTAPEEIPLKILPTQCPFCFWDERLGPSQRTYRYSRAAKMMDHVENNHLPKSGSTLETLKCPHPLCDPGLAPIKSIPHMKNHIYRVHGVKLRR